MNQVNVMPSEVWYSLLPLIIAGVVILGVVFFIILAILVSRRMTITIRTGGAIALTLASILLLSGLWCMFISPVTTYSETKESFYNRISIDGLTSWSYPVSVKEEETLSGSTDAIRIYDPSANASGKTFNVRVYDPDGNVVRSEGNVTYSYFNVRALKSGVHRVEVQNPNRQAVECYVQITVSMKVTYRPLEPLGQWLSLVSLPIFGFGIWASGTLAALQKKP